MAQLAAPKQLYEQVRDQIFSTYIANGPGGKIPSNRNLAKTYGTSTATISKALHVLEREGHIERRVGAGTYVLPGKPAVQKHIGIYYGGASSSCDQERENIFAASLDECVQRRILSEGRNCRHYIDIRLESSRTVLLPELQADLDSAQVSSLIVLRTGDYIHQVLPKLGIPVLGFSQDFGWGSLALDFPHAGAEAARYFLAQNCQRVELIHVVFHEEEEPEKGAAWVQPLRTSMNNEFLPHGVQGPTVWHRDMLPSLLREPYTLSPIMFGYSMFKLLWSREDRPDGILVYTDIAALGVRQAMDELGVVAGRDVEIVVMGNREIPYEALKPFRLLSISLEQIAAELCEMAADAERHRPQSTRYVQYQFEPVVRGQTK
jgi:DNA-binding LacI/PurR family transcriptional regulator/DNA-binding transcriptional regulator YhcF (GntR family)